MNAGLDEDEFVTVVSSSDFSWEFATENGRDRSDRLERRLRKVWSAAEEGWQPPLAGDVREKITALYERVSCYAFRGRSVATDRAVALSLLEFAHELGKFTTDVSTRELSLRAGVGKTTVLRSLARLEDLGLIKRGPAPAFGNAGQWVIQLSWVSSRTDHTVLPSSEGEVGCVITDHTGLSPHTGNSVVHFGSSHPAFFRAALGMSAGAVWWDLVLTGHEITVSELSARTGISSSTVRRCLDRLAGEGLVLRLEGRPARYAGVNVDTGTLDRIADEYGTLDWTERTADRYDAERRGFLELARQREHADDDLGRRALEELAAS